MMVDGGECLRRERWIRERTVAIGVVEGIMVAAPAHQPRGEGHQRLMMSQISLMPGILQMAGRLPTGTTMLFLRSTVWAFMEEATMPSWGAGKMWQVPVQMPRAWQTTSGEYLSSRSVIMAAW
jgi:hypothetical protein